MIVTRRARFLSALLLALAALVAAGCEEKFAATSVDSSKALDALKTTLDAWKKGDAADTLKTASPAITAQDLDWLGGASLTDYAIEGQGDKVDSNLKVPVKLTLKTKDGKDVTKTVKYLVTTSPSITVFRAFP
jgi:hypothetical protein